MTSVQEKEEKVKKLVPPLAGQNFVMLGQVSLDFHATPRVGITLEDILYPFYWGVVASQLKTGCEIRVIPEDNSWYAKLLVLNIPADKMYADVALIHFSDLGKKSSFDAGEFEVRPTQNNTRYGAFRKIGNQIIKGGFITEKQANDFLQDYVRAAAA